MSRDEEIRKQALFVKELTERLAADVCNSSTSGRQGMPYYTQMQQDIIRIRRELKALSSMIAPQW